MKLVDKKWSILAAITFVFIFLNISAFNTLGVVLTYMVEDLNWTFTSAGLSYTILGIACGLGSLLPVVSLKAIGARNTVAIGCALLFCGYGLCVFGQNIFLFYGAMTLVGFGFAMSGNLPAMWVIGAWFPKHPARVIGFYMMAGAGGSIVGPPLIQWIVATFGWRVHWGAMAAIGIIGIVLTLIIIKDREAPLEPAAVDPDLSSETNAVPAAPTHVEMTYGQALRTSAFALVALAIALLLTAVTTISAVGVSHLVKLGSTAQAGALSLGFFAFIGAIAKGAAGPMCERFSSRRLLAAGALAQGIGLSLLATADNTILLYAWGLVFGLGWGFTYVACTAILLEFFGHEIGARLFAACHFFATVAAFGPLVAGWTADIYGTFAPIFYVIAAAYILAATPILFLKKPAANKLIAAPAS